MAWPNNLMSHEDELQMHHFNSAQEIRDDSVLI